MLTRLQIDSFRNIELANLEFSRSYNFFCGDNGAGKTSLLESIYCLGMGKSFRTTTLSRAIQYQKKGFKLQGQNNEDINVLYQRAENSRRKIERNHAPIQSMLELLDFLPLVIINSDSLALINEGPSYRRQFIDWGMFHVEHDYRVAWKKVTSALKQRNAALKQQRPKTEIKYWDEILIEASQVLDQYRLWYCEKLIECIQDILTRIFSLPKIEIEYYRGWQKDKSLAEIFEMDFIRDTQVGYTRHGPHKSDLIFTASGKPASDILSGGEQKRLLYALKLSQTKLLESLCQKSAVLLLDDLQAELDSEALSHVNTLLRESKTQVFITGTSRKFFESFYNDKQDEMFHVKRGEFGIET